MTDVAFGSLRRRQGAAASRHRPEDALRRRTALPLYGLRAISVGLIFLAIMLISIICKGYTSFFQTSVTLPITFDAKVIDPQATSGRPIRTC